MVIELHHTETVEGDKLKGLIEVLTILKRGFKVIVDGNDVRLVVLRPDVASPPIVPPTAESGIPEIADGDLL